jgi:hypothetical protein
VNTNTEAKGENVLTGTDDVMTLQHKIIIWRKTATEGNLEMFPFIENAKTIPLQLHGSTSG